MAPDDLSFIEAYILNCFPNEPCDEQPQQPISHVAVDFKTALDRFLFQGDPSSNPTSYMPGK